VSLIVVTDETKYLFIDTNVALHYARADKIVWSEVTDHSSNVIIVAPVVLRELDEKKYNAKTIKLQKRAKEYVRWLGSISNDFNLIDIRPDARLHLLAEEPTIDFSRHNLKETIADDQLLACVLSYRDTNNSDVAIVTSDIGLKIKARHHNIEVITLPDRFKLGEEPGKIEQENLLLKKELAEYRNRRPSLAIYAAEVSVLNFEKQIIFPEDNLVNIKPPFIISQLEYVTRGLESEKGKWPLIDNVTTNRLTSNSNVVLTNHNDKSITLKIDPNARARQDKLAADRYNRQLEEYYAKYEDFLKEEYKAIINKGHYCQIAVKVCNNATQLATNVDAIITFPDHIGVSEKWVSIEEPAKPKPPAKPYSSNLFDAARGLLTNPYPDLIPNVPSFVNPHKSGPRINKANDVCYWCNEIKHGFCSTFDSFYIVIPYDHDLTRFQARCSLSCNELPKPQEQVLNFSFNTD